MKTSTLNNKISSLIQTQFPEFIQSEHPVFISFLKYYYQFLESAELSLEGNNYYLIDETQSKNYLLEETEEKIVLESSSNKFTVNEIIIGDTSKASATILVDDFDSNKRLFITSQKFFIPGETVRGQTSGAFSVVSSYRANPVQNIQEFLDYVDVDYTINEFLNKFKESFLSSIPNTLASDISKRNLIKNIKELYAAKGTENGHKLFFKILLGNEDSSIFYPRDNILRVSDGSWSSDKIMRVVENQTSDFNNLIGQKIYTLNSLGAISAEAIVFSVVKFRENDVVVAELNLDNESISGTFNENDTVYGIDPTLDTEISAVIKSVIIGAEIIDNGAYYDVGDYVNIGDGGNNLGIAKIDSVGTGSINEVLVQNGGSNYSVDDTVYFDITGTEGTNLIAEIRVVGGSISLENKTSPDHLITEDEDFIISEDNFYFQFEETIGDTELLLNENGDSIVLEEETFNDLGVSNEIGEIRNIKILNSGNGFSKLPKVSITSSTGSNAELYALSTIGKKVGHVESINIVNFGLNYSSPPSFELNKNIILKNISGNFTKGDQLISHTAEVVDFNVDLNLIKLKSDVRFSKGDLIQSAIGATAEVYHVDFGNAVVNVGTIGTLTGEFANDRGKISNSSMRLQDNYYYQDFSYVVRVSESINNWRNSVKKFIHPTGWNLFGEVSFSTLLSARIDIPVVGDSVVPSTSFESIFSVIFGRRLGDSNNTSLSSNPMRYYEELSELNDRERDLTFRSEQKVSLDVNRLSVIPSNTLANLAKYAFAVPPLTTSEYIRFYPNPTGRYIRDAADETDRLFTIEQFGQYKINYVSYFPNLLLENKVSEEYSKILLEDESGNLQSEVVEIPEIAYKTKINVPPPSQINIL